MAVAIIFDAVIVLAAILGIVIGFKKGLIKMFVLRFKKLTSLVFAVLLAKPFGALLTKYFMAEKVSDWVMSAGNLTDVPAESPEALLESVPSIVRFFAKIFSYDLEGLANTAYENGYGMQRALVNELSYPVAAFISVILVFIILYIVLRISIKLMGGMIENVFELPVLKQVNAISGALVAFVLYAILIWILCRIFGWLLTTEAVGQWAATQGFTIERTFIVKYIYNFNPIAFIFSVNPK